jgi:hypothetical protein
LQEITDKWSVSIRHVEDFYVAICSATQQDIQNEVLSLKNILD